jgi:hypothetical protein
VAFGIFAAGAVLAAAGLCDARHDSHRARRTAARWNRWNRPGVLVATLGVAAVAVDGLPPWGSDVGGVLALVPGFAVLVWLLTGVRVSWRKAVGIGFTAIGIIAVFAVVDYARPAARQTHLGRFVGDVIHGGAWSIVRRKALADVRLLGYSVLTLLIPVMVAVAIWLVRRPPAVLRQTFARAAVLRPVLVALLVTVVVGAVLNDSGVVIPALAVVVALPATMAVVVASSRSGPAGPVGPVGEVIEPPASLLP